MREMKRIMTILLLALATLSARAQVTGWHNGNTTAGEGHRYAYQSADVGAPRVLFLKTNLLYDVVLMPTLGVEMGFGSSWTFQAEGTFNWLSRAKKHDYWRIGMGSLEARYWLGGPVSALLHKGHHFGVYAAGYRYDIEFGGKGQMGDFNYGGGISYGYSKPVGKHLSFDFGLAVGYVGGKYKEYEPIDNHYVWQADKTRAWFGPTKVEVSLVWHIELKKKGGLEW